MEWIPLICAGLLFALLLVLRCPAGGALGLYALLLPFDTLLIPARIGGIHLHLTWFVGAAAAGILLALGLLGRGFVFPPRASMWLGLLVFWAILSSFWAMNTDLSTFRVPVLVLLIALYLIAVSVPMSEQEISAINWLAIIGGCVAAGASLYSFIHGEWFSAWGAVEAQFGRETLAAGERATNPNTLAASLILPFSICFAFVFSNHTRLKRSLLILLVAAIGASICATMSRGAMFGAAIVVLVLLKHFGIKTHMLLAIAALAIVVMAMPQFFFMRFAESFEDRGAGRLDIWVAGLHALQHRPIIGAGLDCFPLAYTEFVHTASNFVGVNRAAHNAFLGAAVELGGVGLLLLTGATVGHLLISAKARHSDLHEGFRMNLLSLEAACWGYIACGMFLDLLWEQYFWLTFILLVITVRSREAATQSNFGKYWTSVYGAPVRQELRGYSVS